MHDTTWLEINGIPSIMIASDAFIDAAQVQADALGLPELRRVFVAHPIQDATDAEMRAKADAIIDELIDLLTD